MFSGVYFFIIFKIKNIRAFLEKKKEKEKEKILVGHVI
jgi:hypothetical protein